MKTFASLFVVAVVAGLMGPAQAQSPFGVPRPDLGKQAECTKDYRQSLDLQVAALEKLKSAAPDMVGQVCTLIERGSDWLGGELSDGTRQRIKGLLGFDVDLRFIKTQCRVGQGNLDRELVTELGFLKSEQLRCSESTI